MVITGSGTCNKSSQKRTSGTLPISFTTFARWVDSKTVGGSNWGNVDRTLTGLTDLSTVYFEISCGGGGSYVCSGANARILVIGI